MKHEDLTKIGAVIRAQVASLPSSEEAARAALRDVAGAVGVVYAGTQHSPRKGYAQFLAYCGFREEQEQTDRDLMERIGTEPR